MMHDILSSMALCIYIGDYGDSLLPPKPWPHSDSEAGQSLSDLVHYEPVSVFVPGAI